MIIIYNEYNIYIGLKTLLMDFGITINVHIHSQIKFEQLNFKQIKELSLFMIHQQLCCLRINMLREKYSIYTYSFIQLYLTLIFMFQELRIFLISLGGII